MTWFCSRCQILHRCDGRAGQGHRDVLTGSGAVPAGASLSTVGLVTDQRGWSGWGRERDKQRAWLLEPRESLPVLFWVLFQFLMLSSSGF